MRQITIHNVHKATKADIKAWIPFQIISDGEIIGVVSSPYDVHKASHDVNKPRLSPWDLKYGTHKVRCANSLAEKYRTCVR